MKTNLVPNGVWQTEPDQEEWTDEATGYRCLIKRSESSGALCGYVSVPKEHPLHNEEYSKVYKYNTKTANLEVHGGLTFSGILNGLWYFGFDCAHYRDFLPSKNFQADAIFQDAGTVYRDFGYVKDEVKNLARQLKELENVSKTN